MLSFAAGLWALSVYGQGTGRDRFGDRIFEGLIVNEPGAYKGKILISPSRAKEAYLVDENGAVLNEWRTGFRPAASAYLLKGGKLARTSSPFAFPNVPHFKAGGSGGLIEVLDESGRLDWRFRYASRSGQLHHDFAVMPNGNFLCIAWGRVSKDEAIAAGRRPDHIYGQELWYGRIIEVRPKKPIGGEIVWEWNSWDHVIQDVDSNKPNYGVVSQHPNKIDVNYYRKNSGMSSSPDENGKREKGNSIGGTDWMHCNSIDYDPRTGLIILSVHGFDEIWVIDRNKSDQGIAYRYGNPKAYRAGGKEDQVLSQQHDANWIDEGMPGEGNVMVFNNGNDLPHSRNRSEVMELELPRKDDGFAKGADGSFVEAQKVWSYSGQPGETFYALRMSGAQRLPNGNTLICHGPKGRIFQVTGDGRIVWEYWNEFGPVGPENASPRRVGSVRPVFKVRSYPMDF